jgi:hypothetical protein
VPAVQITTLDPQPRSALAVIITGVYDETCLLEIEAVAAA